MQGELPPEIKYLFELTRIDFSNNDIEGSVPDEWSFLKNLGTNKQCRVSSLDFSLLTSSFMSSLPQLAANQAFWFYSSKYMLSTVE